MKRQNLQLNMPHHFPINIQRNLQINSKANKSEDATVTGVCSSYMNGNVPMLLGNS